MQTRVDYLGHIVEDGHIRPLEHKIETVKNFPAPINVRQIQQFLDLVEHFQKLIPSYSIIARSLINLLKSGVSLSLRHRK